MPKNQQTEGELIEVELCKKCGSKLIEEDGVKVCPKCSGEINFFGDDDESDI